MAFTLQFPKKQKKPWKNDTLRPFTMKKYLKCQSRKSKLYQQNVVPHNEDHQTLKDIAIILFVLFSSFKTQIKLQGVLFILTLSGGSKLI